MGTLANGDDLDEMQQNAASHQGHTAKIRIPHYNLDIPTYPLKK